MPRKRKMSTQTFTRLLDRYAEAVRSLESHGMHPPDIERPLIRKKIKKIAQLRLALIEWAVAAIMLEH